MSDRTVPIWTRRARDFPPLAPMSSRLSAGIEDVVVVGAGIAGLSVALALLEQGRRVTILERDAIGAGQTLRTSAHLASALDDRFHALERWHGQDGARQAARSHALAIDRIEGWSAQYAIDCGFARVEAYLLEEGASDEDEFEREFDAARRAGLDVEMGEAPNGFGPGRALRFGGQARFDPAAWLAGLARAVAARGGIFLRADVVEVDGGPLASLRTRDGDRIAAHAVVLATNVPFHETVPIHTKQAPYRTFVVACPIEREAFPDVLLWDMGDPYHYVRRVDDEDDGRSWLLVGGGDHKTGQDHGGAAFDAMLEWARRRVPGAGAPEWSWSGQVLEPVDGLGFIGQDPGGKENVYVVTGDSGNGLTHGTIAADVIPALVFGGDDPYAGLYALRRKPIRALGTWLAENANVAAQYRDWVAPGELRALDPPCGTVVRQGVHRIAVSRAADGALHGFSAICPHLGCIVRWNEVEGTWDCPCHGSRFDACDGHVLNGPAASGLDPVDVPD